MEFTLANASPLNGVNGTAFWPAFQSDKQVMSASTPVRSIMSEEFNNTASPSIVKRQEQRIDFFEQEVVEEAEKVGTPA